MPARPQHVDDLESGIAPDQSQPAPFNGSQSANRTCGCHCSKTFVLEGSPNRELRHKSSKLAGDSSIHSSVPSIWTRRRSFSSDSSDPAPIASSTASLNDGPPLGPVPSILGHLVRAIFWNRLHSPPFADIPLNPELISEPKTWRQIWLAVKIFLKVAEDKITHPGCARIPTKKMVEKVQNEYNHSLEVVRRLLYERTKSINQGPEIISRPRLFDKSRPWSSCMRQLKHNILKMLTETLRLTAVATWMSLDTHLISKEAIKNPIL